jgi:hypothetical protein
MEQALHHQVVRLGDREIDLFEPEGRFGEDEDVLEGLIKSVEQLVRSGRKDIRVGCGLMTTMSTVGFGVILRALAFTRGHGGRLTVDAQGNWRVRYLLEIVKFPFDDGSDDGMAGRTAPLIPPPAPPRAQREEPPSDDPDGGNS